MSFVKEKARRLLSHVFERLYAAHLTWRWRRLIDSGIVTVGRHTYGVPVVFTFKGNESNLEVGAFTSITTGTKILLGGNHPTKWVSTFPFRSKWNMPGAYEDGMPYSKGDVRIGSDVWIAVDCVILSGVNIGDGAIVMSGSHVTADIEPYSIAGGIPAKVVAKRFPEDIIEKMLKIRWWNWDDDTIRKAVPFLSSGNMAGFLEKYKSYLC